MPNTKGRGIGLTQGGIKELKPAEPGWRCRRRDARKTKVGIQTARDSEPQLG